MTSRQQPPAPVRRRRADAERSVAAILDAAVVVFGERPNASMEDVARAAGVTRQTVYAHYPSRERLLSAVQQRALAAAVAAIDATRPDEGPPPAALERLIAAGWETLERHARVLGMLIAPLSPSEMHALHAPIVERLQRLVRRGQRSGDFDRGLPADWVVGALLGLLHATGEEVAAGRMDADAARAALARAVPRMLGVTPD